MLTKNPGYQQETIKLSIVDGQWIPLPEGL